MTVTVTDYWFDYETKELVGISPLADDVVLPKKMWAIQARSLEEAKAILNR